MTWKEALQSTRVRWAIVFCMITFLLMVLLMPAYYRDIINPKRGFQMDDPLLNFFTPRDWYMPIFFILYVAVGDTFYRYFRNPGIVLLGVTTYCAVNIVRTITMYIITLEPPSGMILLTDPISSALYPSTGFAKDLFFSGHVSTIMIVVLLEKNRLAKALKALGTVIIAVLLAWQRVHYTLDLLAAPVFTYLVFLIVQKYLEIRAENGGLAGNTESN
jgi:PAP2 superfamily C-terminal